MLQNVENGNSLTIKLECLHRCGIYKKHKKHLALKWTARKRKKRTGGDTPAARSDVYYVANTV